MNDFLEQLLVVLVIYKMEIAKSPAYHSLTQALTTANKSTALFIYDNSPNVQQPPLNTAWSVHYFHDPSNPGVSKAYNEGVRVAKQTHKKWMLLIDQDTLFPINCLDGYFKAVTVHPIAVPILRDDIGIVSPLRFYFGGGQRVKSFENRTIFKLKEFLFHNSGLLLATETFEKAGGYDENLRLDFSDFAFVHRLRNHNEEFMLANFSCAHGLATTEVKTLNDRLERFETYVSAGSYFKKTYARTDLLLSSRIFLRGVKLCLRYRTFKFILSIFRR